MEPLIQSSFITELDPLLREKGLQPDTLYRQAHLSPPEPGNLDSKISFFRELRLLEMASCYFDQPDFCLSLTQRQPIEALGKATDDIPKESTLGEALLYLSSRLYLSLDDTHIKLEEHGDVALLKLHCTDKDLMTNTYLQNHGLALLHMFLMKVSTPGLRLRAVHFRHNDQRGGNEFFRHYQAPLAYDSDWAGLALNASYLKQKIIPVTTTADYTACRKAKKERLTCNTKDKVLETIASLLRQGECHIDAAATRLGLSKRTLQRRLLEEECNFQDLVNEIRKQQALTLLQNPSYRLIDVAEVLGYTRLSAFSRSFKRWYGTSPQEWQRQQKSSIDR
ncbi:helix-turn-helix domain-containing protein [Pseudomaricurvus sp.]|uniref:AraC family transcriptional regulator n=1 Tax=Pseudomaricurvus sp. TaxID=2004510 RepID=UPI003F6AF77C